MAPIIAGRRAIIPNEVRQLVGVAIVIKYPVAVVRIFMIGKTDGNPEVSAPSPGIEHLLIGEVGQRVDRMTRSQGRALEEGWRPARAEIVGDPPLVPHAEGRARLEIEHAADRVGALVRGL